MTTQTESTLSQIEREQLFQVARMGVVSAEQLVSKIAAKRLERWGWIYEENGQWLTTPLGEIRTAAEVARARESGAEVAWWREGE